MLDLGLVKPETSRASVQAFRLEGTPSIVGNEPVVSFVAGLGVPEGVSISADFKRELAELVERHSEVKLVMAETKEEKQQKRRLSRNENADLKAAKKLLS